MKNINNYFKGFDGSNKKIDYLKYGLFNTRGSILDSSPKKIYKDDEYKKIECNIGKNKLPW